MVLKYFLIYSVYSLDYADRKQTINIPYVFSLLHIQGGNYASYHCTVIFYLSMLASLTGSDSGKYVKYPG